MIVNSGHLQKLPHLPMGTQQKRRRQGTPDLSGLRILLKTAVYVL